jgi:ketosteroid isomerase-like protein
MTTADGPQRKAVVASLFRLYSSGQWATANSTLLEEDGRWEIQPRSVGGQRTVAEHDKYLGEVMPDFAEFSITPHLVIYEEIPGGAGVIFATCTSRAQHRDKGAYGQDYVFTFFFRPGSLRINKVTEFVDSYYSARFFARSPKRVSKI